MDRALALEKLGLADQDWGLCAGQNFTHAEFVETWRGVKPCPTEKDIIAADAVAQTTIANGALIAQIAALDQKRIRPMAEGDTVYLAKLNERIKALRAQLK